MQHFGRAAERLHIARRAVHMLDGARLYKLVLEKGSAGARYHAVAEEGVPIREIAEVIARGLRMPVVTKTGDGAFWLAAFVGSDLPASSARTQDQPGWRPSERSLISDLEEMNYLEGVTVTVCGATALSVGDWEDQRWKSKIACSL